MNVDGTNAFETKALVALFNTAAVSLSVLEGAASSFIARKLITLAPARMVLVELATAMPLQQAVITTRASATTVGSEVIVLEGDSARQYTTYGVAELRPVIVRVVTFALFVAPA